MTSVYLLGDMHLTQTYPQRTLKDVAYFIANHDSYEI